MKQQVLCCLLLTISVGLCHNYGVKGSFSKSFSSSSSAASSSAFSSSFSSAEDAALNDITNSLQPGAQAVSASFAKTGTFSGSLSDANSGAFAAGSGSGSGSYSKSGSFSGSGIQAIPAEQLGHSANSGSYSKSGSFSGSAAPTTAEQLGQSGNSGSYSKSGSFSSSGIQETPAEQLSHAGNSGSYSKSGSLSGTGIQGVPAEQLGHSGNSGSYSKSGSLSNTGNSYKSKENDGSIVGVIDVTGQVPGNNPSLPNTVKNTGSKSGTDGSVFINDFQIPEEFQSPQTKENLNKVITGYKSTNYDKANSDSKSYSKTCCQGPFPGPAGSIHDYKPAPPGGGSPVQVHQPVVVTPTQPIPVNTGYYQTVVDVGTTGLSSQLIHSFPGSHGSIHDSKPVYSKPETNIPVGIIPVVVETPQYNPQPAQTHVPGSAASSVIGTLPGPTGSIYTSVPAGQHPTVHQIPVKPSTIYDNTKPAPSFDIINSFPGKPGNIHDNKVVSNSPCTGKQCQSNKNVYTGYQHANAGTVVSGNYKPKFPDCSTGQCDEFGGKLGCHGNDCFGPGKKPSNAHFAGGSNANSYTKHGTGSISVDLTKPTEKSKINVIDVPVIIEQTPYINGYSTPVSNNLPNVKVVQQPAPVVTIVDVVPTVSEPKPHVNMYPAPGSINFGISQPVPTYPGTLCSGLDCLLPPVSGTKQLPTDSISGCSGAYCINAPEVSETTGCSGGNCENKATNNQPKTVYGSKSSSNVYNPESQDKIVKEQPVEIDIPLSPIKHKENTPKELPSTTNKPHHKEPVASQDFLLPGNKPHHQYHPNIKSHQPTTPSPKKHPEKTPGEGYYTCTGTSCPLPKHPGQLPYQTTSFPEQNKPQPTTGQPVLKPFHIPDEYKGDSGHDRPYPGYSQKELPIDKPETNCNGNSCTQPQFKPFNIPEGYTGAGGHDRLYPANYNQNVSPTDKVEPKCNGNFCSTQTLKPFNIPDEYKGPSIQDKKEPSPLVIPVLVKGEPQSYQNTPTGTYNTGYNSGANSFAAGKVVVEKSDGVEIPIFDVKIPGGANSPGYSCSGRDCDGPKQTTSDGFSSGTYTGSSGENDQGNGCSGGLCRIPIRGDSGSYGGFSGSNLQGNFQRNGCASGKCGTSGSYGGSKNGNLPGNFQGNECSSGKCGTSGYYGDSESGNHQGNFQGNGCATGKCGSNGAASGSYTFSGSGSQQGHLLGNGCSSGNCGTSGSYRGQQQTNLQGTGCTGGKCGTDLGGGSNSGSGSYGGVKSGCTSGICGVPANSGSFSSAFSSSSSFSGSGGGAVSGGNSGAVSGANSGAHSSSGSFSNGGQGAGFEGFPLLKELIDQSVRGHSGAGSFSKASSYSGGSSSHSASYSSSGSFSAK